MIKHLCDICEKELSMIEITANKEFERVYKNTKYTVEVYITSEETDDIEICSECVQGVIGS